MTILPKKKERNQSKSNSGGGPQENHADDGHYHHTSPPRWQRPDRNERNSTTVSLVPDGVGRDGDPNKRSSPDSDSVVVLDSGPSHGSKRRHRAVCGYPSWNPLPSTRSKSKSSNSSGSCSSGSVSSPCCPSVSPSELDSVHPGTSHEECGTVGSLQISPAVDPSTMASEVGVGGRESPSGYNSGDEYDNKPMETYTPDQIEEMERRFEKKISKKGFIIKKMGEDGACLFRAVADQVYGDQEMHSVVRKLCMDYMSKNSDYYSQYITEDFSEYVQRKRCDHSHGNHIEIQALSEMFNRPIEVYHYSTEPINIFQGCQQTDNEPVRLSYHKNIHYNSVVDPYKATVGVGLGLPSFKPGLAEKSLVDKAIRVSEEHELEKAMLEDKLRATDWEATSEAIEEQVARESYVEWLRENEKRAIKKKSKLCSSATSTATNDTHGNNNQMQQSPSPSRLSPKASSSGLDGNNKSHPSCDFKLIETASFVNQMPPHMFGVTDYESQEEGDLLARVLAQSQQEYLDSLKRNACNSTSSDCNSSLMETINVKTPTPSSSKLK